MKSLTELMGSYKETPGELSLDLSDVFGTEDDGTPVTFVYKEPGISEMFMIAKDTPAYRELNPDWPPAMASTVAYMAVAHVSPPMGQGASVGQCYIAIANEKPKLFQRLWEAVCEKFITAGNLDKAVEAKKES